MHNIQEKYVRLIKQYIERYREEFWEDPLISEIAWNFQMPEELVQDYLTYMNENSIIEYDTDYDLQHEEDSEEDEPASSEYIDLKHLSQTDNERGISLDNSFVDEGNFYVKAPDDSMIEAHIEMGDFVLLNEQDYAEPGQIIYTTINGTSMLRRYFPENESHRIRLHPENVMLKDIYVEKCDIEGVAVKIIKDLSMQNKKN